MTVVSLASLPEELPQRVSVSRCNLCTQSKPDFKRCSQLLKLLWNREYAAAWPVLRGQPWPDAVQPMVQQLDGALQQRVVSFINKAFSSIRVDNACSLLGAHREELLQGDSL